MKKLYKGKYYLYFEPYTYIKENSKSVFLLNTLDNQYIIHKDQRIINLVKNILSKPSNILELDFDEIYTEDVYLNFFNMIRKKYLGDLIDTALSRGEPINYYPQLHINNDFRKKGIETSLGFGKYDNCIFNINLFLNTNCLNECFNCNNYYKQFNCCSKLANKTQSKFIDIKTINKIFKNYEFNNLDTINILGGNISLFPQLDSLLCLLSDYKEKSHAFVNYFNLINVDKRIKSFFDKNISIIVDMSLLNKEDIKKNN